MLYAVAKGMYQNIVTFHAANGMFNKDTDLTQGCIGSLLIIAQLRVGILFTHVQGVRLNHTIFAREARPAIVGDCTPL